MTPPTDEEKKARLETKDVTPTYSVATLDDAEAYQIELAMSASGNNHSAAAKALGIDSRRLKRLLKKHGLY